MAEVFRDRVDAGNQLAELLSDYKGRSDVLVLALPRGGVPVASRVAAEIKADLDVLIVRKVGLPSNPELAMGAVASGGVEVVNDRVVQSWSISGEQFKQIARRELEEVERREALYRKGRAPLQVEGKTIVLVDDGIATGSTAKAAIQALQQLGAKQIVVAIPVAAQDTVRELEDMADRVVCVSAPADFRAVGLSYEDFSQTSDPEVCELLGAGT